MTGVSITEQASVKSKPVSPLAAFEAQPREIELATASPKHRPTFFNRRQQFVDGWYRTVVEIRARGPNPR